MDTAQSRYLHIFGNKKIALALISAAFFIVAVGAVWLMRSSPLFPAANSSTQVNLLKSGWDHIPGVTPAADGLHVSYLGRAIVQQDGSPGQQNPSVNLYGTHLHATKDFTLSAELKDIKGGASFRLYAEAPVVQDEFRVEPKGLDMNIDGSTLTIARWDGYKNQKLLQQKAVTTDSYTINSRENVTLTLERTGSQLVILADGKKLTTLPYTNYFNQDIWFGLTAPRPTNSWRLASLTAHSTTEGSMSAINTQQTAATQPTTSDPLQTLAKNKRSNFLIGAAVALTPSVADEKYRNLVYGGNFGMITTENVLKWQFIHPQPLVYDFKEADALVDIARKNKLRVQGHTLVFGEANPKWVQDLPTATTADKDNVKQVMTDHITKTVTHFGNRIMAWDVVNEPLAAEITDGDIFRKHKWYDAMGEDYIATALTTARAANPKAKLYINDYGLEADGERWDAMLALVKKLKAQNVPLDGIGFESHVYEAGDEIDPIVLRRHIQALNKLGVTSHVSEMDVHSDDGSVAQAKQYADVLSVCISEPSCTSWATWGVTNRYNMYEADSGKLQYGEDFMWDAQSNPTPAVAEIQKVLKK
jgi:endo-1,4-beta-xylanase